MKKIIFLSWKDIKHPDAWWAEVVLWNYIKNIKNKWYDITWIGSGFGDSPKKETINWVKIIRVWNINSIYFIFPTYYRKNLKWKFDLIIDEAWWFPMLSPIFEKDIPIIFLIHHISDIEWDFKYIFPFNLLWRFLYRKSLDLYKNKYTITVSKSSKDELVDKYFFDKKKVFEIENTIDFDKGCKINLWEKKNEIAFFSRITPMKRLEHAILAFRHFVNKYNKKYKLNIFWKYKEWKYLNWIKDLIKSLSLEDLVEFKWNIKNKKDISKSKILLLPSYKEWYWIVVLEANSYGIPAIWYDVWGVRDSIKDGINGFKVKDWDYEAMWEKMYDILKNEKNYINLAKSSFNHIKNHRSCEKNSLEFEKIIKKVLNDRTA